MKGRLALVALAGGSAVWAGAAGNPAHDARSAARVRAVDSIASPAGPGAAEPNLTVGPDGRVYLSWLEPADSGFALKFAVHDGSRWSNARTIRRGRDFFVNWADFPSVEVLANGRLAAHWLQRNGAGTYAYGVRVSQSADRGQTWSTPVIPHRDSSESEHGFVSMWRDGGDLGAVWLDGRKFNKQGHTQGHTQGHSPTNEMMVVSTTIDAKGKRGAEVRLDERTCDCCQTAAAVTANGPVVIYRDRSPDEIRDIYIVRRVGGKWTVPAPLHKDDWHIAACPVNGPAISANGRRAAVAWFTAARDTAKVQVAFSNDAGASFGVPIRVDAGAPAGRVDVALLPDGRALVSWIERTGGDTATVRARFVGANGKADAPITIATSSAARASGFPRMAVSGGNVMFAWTVPGKPSAVRVARASIASLR